MGQGSVRVSTQPKAAAMERCNSEMVRSAGMLRMRWMVGEVVFVRVIFSR